MEPIKSHSIGFIAGTCIGMLGSMLTILGIIGITLDNTELLSQIGDFTGGILNPLLGMLTVAIVYCAYLSQKKIQGDNTKILHLHRKEVTYQQCLKYLELLNKQRSLINSREHTVKLSASTQDGLWNKQAILEGDALAIAERFDYNHKRFCKEYDWKDLNVKFEEDGYFDNFILRIELKQTSENIKKTLIVVDEIIENCVANSVKIIHIDIKESLTESLKNVNNLKEQLDNHTVNES